MRQSLFNYCRLYQKQFLLDEWENRRCRRRRLPMAASGPFGGVAKRDVADVLPSLCECLVAAVRSAQGIEIRKCGDIARRLFRRRTMQKGKARYEKIVHHGG